MKRLFLPLLAVGSALAQAPQSPPSVAAPPAPLPSATVRPVPPPGVAVPEADRARLTEGLKKLRAAIDEAAKAQAKNPQLADLLPDIEIYHKAVDWALRYNEVHKLPELKSADELIAEGLQRAEQFKTGQAPWTKQKGLVVRAYRSKIDGSVQPYGMIIPESYVGAPTRLDTWCHGRGETLSELGFLDQRRKQVGQIAPKGALVLHPYGRYCCANKFAGEIDLIEAIDHASKFYAIDEDRVIVRGFSMGGGAAWQFAVNYTDKWCAANPGAGFAETPEFLGPTNETVTGATWYQQKLWHWYNSTDNALNLENCPTVAYSGEIDKQKQAADMMEKALRGENVDLMHVIGPQTGHKIHPDSLIEIEKRLASIAAIGRNRAPKEIHLSTWFLRYNHMFWVTVDALEEHWVRGRIHARITGPSEITIKLQNISAFTLDMPSGYCPLPLLYKPVVSIDGQLLEVTRPKLDRSWLVHFQMKNGKWTQTLDNEGDGKLVKKHGLQGPIDDAFMDKFIFVKPTKAGFSEKVDSWAKAELERAQTAWRGQFRGDAPIKDDSAISDADIAANNLVLWGDPQSNAVLSKIADKLPIQWSKDKLIANGKTYDATTNAPILIYPNPLNPTKYIVINSGFTYREFDYLNNASQVAKLPDWAVIDVSKPKTSMAPGGLSDGGFFGENWEWKAAPVKK